METPTNAPAISAEELAAAKAAEAEAKAKAKAEAERAQKKAAKEAEKAEAKAKREADIQAKKQAKIDAAAAAEKAKEDSKQPKQNDVRRPRAGTITGQCWDVYDRLSAERGSPASITDCRKVLEAQGVNIATIRTQYAHWRKFNGVSGRVDPVAAPVPPALPPVDPQS